MISRYSFNRFIFGSSWTNGVLNLELRPWKECKLFRKTSVSFEDRKRFLYQGETEIKQIKVWRGITVKEVAGAFKIKLSGLAFLLPDLKLKAEDQIHSLSILKPAADKLGYKLLVVSPPDKIKRPKKDSYFEKQPPSKPENLVKRCPVVTVMGHVDHGKTTLLDSLRNSFVVQQEFGGITQHIGAFSVEVKPGERITFIDTPGHAAFTAMRSRGTQVTDLVVLVIAADDGVMEQTIESIKIANAAQVPMIIAINKIDKPTTTKIEDIKQKLLEEGIQVEDQGGEVQLVPISALKKINLDLLTEVILLQAELMHLKGDPTGLVEGVIIESKMDNLGIVATVIVKRGTLEKGRILVSGLAFSKVRKMLDENGNDLKEAPPSTPVQILGWKELPLAGDEVFEVPTEKKAKLIISERKKEAAIKKCVSEKEIIEKKAAEHQEKHNEFVKKLRSTSEYKERKLLLLEQRKQDIINAKEQVDIGPHLKVLLKGDVYGTLEVLLEILGSYDKEEECKLSVVHASLGDVKQNDLDIAESFKAVIYAFNVTLHPTVLEFVKDKNIDIRYHNVIYKLIDDVKEELTARIPPKDEEEITGEAEVLQNFLISQGKKKVPVAGARCIQGQLKKNSMYRILRDGETIYEGTVDVMKNEKQVVKSIPKGMECGLLFESFPDKFKPGDKIICYDMVKVSQKTSWDPGF